MSAGTDDLFGLARLGVRRTWLRTAAWGLEHAGPRGESGASTLLADPRT